MDSEDTRECEAMRKMFVGGLNRKTSDDTFFSYFGEFGTMVDKVIIKDPQTQMSRGFGFVTYESSDCVEAVFQARPHEIDGKTLDVKRAMPRDYNTSTAHAKVTKLFIGGIAPDLTPEELQTYIESRHPTSVGQIEKIDFLKDRETSKNKGFGFLECGSTDFADRLTISENSFTLNGKRMSLKKAEPKPGEGGHDGASRGRGGGQRGGGFQGRGGQRGGGFQGRDGGQRGGGGRGRGRGGRGGGGSYGHSNGYDNGYNNSKDYGNYSTGYPGYGDNTNTGFNSYPQGHAAGGNYGGQQTGGGYGGGYGGGNQGQGWNSGGGNRFQPY